MDLFVEIVWGVNSAVECHLHTVEVTGSNPVRPIFIKQPFLGCFFLPKDRRFFAFSPDCESEFGEKMKRALTIEDLFKIRRPSEFALSPDGKTALVVAKDYDLPSNASSRVLMRFDLEAKAHVDGAMGNVAADAHDLAFSGDGKSLFYVHDDQLWRANADGTQARQITMGVGGVLHPVSTFDGSRVIFTRQVYMVEAAQAEYSTTKKHPSLAKIYGLQHPKARARVADSLMYRHWDSWTENRRNHLFIVDVESLAMTDITPEDADVPPIALDSGCDYDISPDGKHVVYVKNPDAMIARSTNNSIYLGDLDGLTLSHVRRISTTDGCDTAPKFLTNRRIAYLSMTTPGYEADAVRLKVFDMESQETRIYGEDFERSFSEYVQVEDDVLLFGAQDFAHSSLYKLDLRSGAIEQLTQGRTYTHFTSTWGMGRVVALVESLECPAEFVELSNFIQFSPQYDVYHESLSQEKLIYLTQFGRDAIDDVEMNRGQKTVFRYKDIDIEGYVVLPPGFDESKKYPLILLIHGGPQGAFLDSFHYRWNVELFASRGAVVAFCNPHGSTGYGHDLTRAISKHWSDDCPAAIMGFVDHVLAQYRQIDADRMTAAGASFGGFMINWLMGHTDRFKALVSHDGIFNTQMSGYITDELWFCDYEFGGTPYEAPEAYERHSPHRFVENFKTPTLVVQGEQDFRCFISEGVGLFTALQYKGVESRLLYFPNEGHWVLDPADSFVWYSEVLDWLMNHVKSEV